MNEVVTDGVKEGGSEGRSNREPQQNLKLLFFLAASDTSEPEQRDSSVCSQCA